jgi:hypothetical protein
MKRRKQATQAPRKGQSQPAIALEGVVAERIIAAAKRIATEAERIAETLRIATLGPK